MKLITFPASQSGSPDTPEWHAWRAKGIGGSEAGAIAADAGLIDNPAAWMPSLHRLWLLKTGQAHAKPMNMVMQRGRDGEKAARIAFEEKTGIMMSPVFAEMEDHPVVRASLDGMSLGGNEILEVKCPALAVHEMAKQGEVVEYYLPQLAHQGMVAWGHPGGWTNNQRFFFASYLPTTADLAIVEVAAPRLAALAFRLLGAELHFWGLVESRVPPAGDEWVDLARRFVMADREFEAAEQARNEIRAQLVELLGNEKRMDGGGVLAYRNDVKGKVNIDKVLKALAEKYQIPDVEIEELKTKSRSKSKDTVFVKLSKESEAEDRRGTLLAPAQRKAA